MRELEELLTNSYLLGVTPGNNFVGLSELVEHALVATCSLQIVSYRELQVISRKADGCG